MTTEPIRHQVLGRYPLTYAQQNSLRIKSDRQQYFTYIRLRMPLEINLTALQIALGEMIHYHSALRTYLEQDQRQQVELKVEGKIFLPYWQTRIDQCTEYILEAMQIPLNLNHWPLFRWMLIQDTKGHLLLWQISHLFLDLFSVTYLAEELIRRYEFYQEYHAQPSSRPLIEPQNYVQAMQQLNYSPSLMQQMQDYLFAYGEAVKQVKQMLVERAVKTGAGEEFFFNRKYPVDLPVATIMAGYAWALAEWLSIDTIPIRVGADGRFYPRLNGCYTHLVTLANDHYCLTIRRTKTDTLSTIATAIQEQLAFFRENSINFDKLVCSVESEIANMLDRAGHIFSCAPLGCLTVVEGASSQFKTIPRPLWGMSSFHGLSRQGGVKVGIYLFQMEGRLRVHVHQMGIKAEFFQQFVQILSESISSFELTTSE